jgi:DNA-binding transcriptional LysR family regulator
MLNHFYYKKNRIQQLKGFYHTVQTGSISAAAKKMGLSQSAITLQIQSLERDLKVKIFKREKKKIKLTESGKILYSQAVHYIQGIDDLFEGFIKYTTEKKLNEVDLASNHVGISYILPRYIKKFKDENSSVKFKIRNLSKSECVKRLLDGEIDMFIYPMNRGEVPDELEFIPIVKYQPILLVKKGHSLAKKKNLTLKDVAKFELLRIDPHLVTLPAFEEIVKSHGLHSSIEFEISDWEILKKFVKADIGVSIISNIILEGEDDGELIGRPLTNYFPEMTYGVLLKKGKKLEGMLKNFVHLVTRQSQIADSQLEIKN